MKIYNHNSTYIFLLQNSEAVAKWPMVCYNPFPPKKNIQLIGVLIVEWNLLQQVRVFLQLNYALNILPPLFIFSHFSLLESVFWRDEKACVSRGRRPCNPYTLGSWVGGHVASLSLQAGGAAQNILYCLLNWHKSMQCRHKTIIYCYWLCKLTLDNEIQVCISFIKEPRLYIHDLATHGRLY